MNIANLPNTVCSGYKSSVTVHKIDKESIIPVFTLSVHLWVEITVIENDSVCARQTATNQYSMSPKEEQDLLDADAPGTRRRNEAENTRIGVESLRNILPVLDLGRAVKAEIQIAMEVEEDFQDIENPSHLCEDEDAVPSGFPLSKETGELLQLATVVLQQRRIGERDLKLHADPMDRCVEVKITSQGHDGMFMA